MTERQKYEVIKLIDDVEIRRYLPYVAADVLVKEEYEKAGNAGFRPLANYIFSNKISMTAPVLFEERGKEEWQVSFVMPHGSKITEMPTPANNVKLREEKEEICAVIKFSGYTGEKRIKKFEEKLLHTIHKHKMSATGKVRIARFDPPWKPGFIRHNELIVPIQELNQSDLPL